MGTRDECCGNCKHWEPSDETCRKYAPHAGIVPKNFKGGFLVCWPALARSEFCGEFEKAEDGS